MDDRRRLLAFDLGQVLGVAMNRLGNHPAAEERQRMLHAWHDVLGVDLGEAVARLRHGSQAPGRQGRVATFIQRSRRRGRALDHLADAIWRGSETDERRWRWAARVYAASVLRWLRDEETLRQAVSMTPDAARRAEDIRPLRPLLAALINSWTATARAQGAPRLQAYAAGRALALAAEAEQARRTFRTASAERDRLALQVRRRAGGARLVNDALLHRTVQRQLWALERASAQIDGTHNADAAEAFVERERRLWATVSGQEHGA